MILWELLPCKTNKELTLCTFPHWSKLFLNKFRWESWDFMASSSLNQVKMVIIIFHLQWLSLAIIGSWSLISIIKYQISLCKFIYDFKRMSPRSILFSFQTIILRTSPPCLSSSYILFISKVLKVESSMCF
jgi:hypothetical protein